jgi:multisubunit Na+/H+ antiporter MnhE subunit
LKCKDFKIKLQNLLQAKDQQSLGSQTLIKMILIRIVNIIRENNAILIIIIIDEPNIKPNQTSISATLKTDLNHPITITAMTQS